MVQCNLVEKFLFSLFKRFAEDLIREACSDIYFEPNKPTNESSSGQQQQQENVNNNTKRVACQQNQGSDNILSHKFPLYLGVKDVYRTILRHDRYDFLTNKYMGVYTDSEEGNDRSRAESSSNSFLNSRISKLKKNFSDSSLINK